MKFGDLGRNITTSTGLGDILLGAASSGYADIKTMLADGDEFYYTIRHVGLPEVETGVGIYHSATGTFTRSTPTTNFSPGAKNVALVVGAAWFTAVDTLPGEVADNTAAILAETAARSAADTAANTRFKGYPTRADIAALALPAGEIVNLTEAGRAGDFRFSTANLSAQVAADTAQGLYIAPTSDASGASGAWIRIFSGPADFRWFGAVADCTVAGAGTSNTAAFNAARAALLAAGRGWLHIPKQAAAYRFATAPAQITDQIKITGDGWSEAATGVGVAAYNGTILCFDADVAGLRFVGFSDNAANATVAEFPSANESVIRDFMQYSAGGVGTTAHGIATYVTLIADNVRVQGFAGCGVYINGDAVGTSGNQYGNTAFTGLSGISCRLNKIHGFYVNGNNSSVIRFIGCDSFGNGGGGYVQAAGFGNAYLNCHAASNNASFGTPAGFSAAQRAQCVADWPNLADTNCGSWYIPGASDASVLSGCYTEGGGGPGSKLELAEGVIVVGGNVTNIANQKNTYNGTRIDGSRYYGLGEIYAYSGGTVDVKRGSLDISENRGWSNPATSRLLWNSDSGLNIGGSGATYDFALRRADGVAVALLPHNTSTLHITNVQLDNGYLFLNDVSAFVGPLGVNGSGQAFATAAGGVNIAGRGSTYDISLLNTNGVTALRIPTATTNVQVVGTITASNISGTNTGDETQASIVTKIGTNALNPNAITNAAAAGFIGASAAGAWGAVSVATARSILGLATVATTGSAADLSTGTLLAARMPALTGDVTTVAGNVATTVGKINGVALSGLATGILKNTTGTGVPSIAVAGDFPTLNQNTTGSAASLTTSRNFSISGGGITAATVGFNGTAAVVLNASVDAGHITLARMANLAANSIIGNNTGVAATPLALTGTNVTAMLDTFTSVAKGLAPASGGGTTNYLRADGTWAAPPGGGGGVSDGDKGDVVVSSGGTIYTVESAANGIAAAGVASSFVRTTDGIYNVTIGANSAGFNGGELDFIGAGITVGKINCHYDGTTAHTMTFTLGATDVVKLLTTGVAVTGTLSATGVVSGSNLSGTNTGDQTITLTGDVTGSGTGSFAATIANGAVTLAKQANLAANSIIGNNTGSAATPIALTAAQTKTLLAITEADVTNLTTDLAAKAPIANPQFTGVAFYQQVAPTVKNATTTLTIADLLTLIIQSTSTTAVSLTLPTGTLTDAGILSGGLAVNEAFEWYVINTGSSSGAVTLVAGTGHTIIGNAVTAIATSSRWLTRKTAANTFVTYRIA